MEKTNILESKLFRAVVLSIAGLIILAFVFGLGVYVGTKKADFSFRWAEEYHNNFGGPQQGFFGNMMGEEFTNANGVFGQIIKIDSGSLTVKDKDNVEKIILVGDKVSILYQRKSMKLADLKVGDSIVAIGDPNNNGQIQAELIRVMPTPPKNLPPIAQPSKNYNPQPQN